MRVRPYLLETPHSGIRRMADLAATPRRPRPHRGRRPELHHAAADHRRCRRALNRRVDRVHPRRRPPGVVIALLFSQTEVFPAPVPIARSRELCDSMNKPGFFQTTQRIDEGAARRLYEEGMRSDDG